MAPSQGVLSEAVAEVGSAQRAAGIASVSSSSPLSSAELNSSTRWYKLRLHASRAGALWIAGFVEACRIDRAVLLCRRSKEVLKKTGQIFVLNGCIFLGRSPSLRQDGDSAVGRSQGGGLLHSIIIVLCYGLWLFPIYVITFVVNCVCIMLTIGEQIYSIFMLGVFFVEIFAVSYIPYIGQLFSFVMLSWLYAYYCFDYKWGFAKWNLERRLLFFETNWAFFAGFGSPCVLATFFLSPLVSAGVMNVLFPLFVLVATALNQEEVVKKCTFISPSLPNPTRLPIFQIPNTFLGPVLKVLQPRSRNTPSSIDRRKKAY
ncbi:hypothetical protein AXG93_4448s1130 [Marchantia polymorpha subsp. ruderalis]|uniref:Uncharacterized protein n=1 Tax=Marchantia polymorpha subsp. ruderalis TaxID=1480154 RepID=A0A176VCN7_MARPO|nr:hypothetical protein AXG93_4448s1130 [Marchantia polymorpha subsp. ruderalis]